jgi:hypothetical protein
MYLFNLFKRPLSIGLLLILFGLTSYAQRGNGMNGPGNMGKGMGSSMLISGGNPYRVDGRKLEMNNVIEISMKYIGFIGLSGLTLDKIEEWEYNFSIVIKETASPQNRAFELIVDKWTGAVSPGPGPSLMWNQKYWPTSSGMMGGIIVIGGGKMAFPQDAAIASANQFLQERFAPFRSLSVTQTPTIFYGYYNFDVIDNKTGEKYGKLSVNGVNGQVWYHTWYGSFIQSELF